MNEESDSMVLTQEEILLSLVQGNDGQKWAVNRIGWKDTSTEKGKVYHQMCYIVCGTLQRPSTCFVSNSSSKMVFHLACEWEDVECDNHDRIIALLLTDTSLSGSIPSKLAKLSTLKTLRMGTNKLFGSLPREFASLPDLVNLELRDNRLTGTLPTFSSSNIQTIDLGHNDFHGSIPSHIAPTRDSILKKLILSQNRLSGTIPEALSRFSNLNAIDLSSNHLHGEIPLELGDLHLLQHLYLNNNFLVGPIPHTLAIANPDNGRIADLLEEIYLQDNFLTGTIPVQLADLPKLKKLLIYDNKLTGEVPKDICSPFVNEYFFQYIDNGDPEIDYCDAISCPADSVAREGV